MTNVLINFQNKIKKSIEVRTNNKTNKLQVEAKNCYVMLLYVGSEDNQNKRQVIKADAVKFDAVTDSLDTHDYEEWTQVKDVTSFQIWLPNKEHEELVKHDFMVNTDTSYQASSVTSYLLLRKRDITKITVDSGKSPAYYSSYPNASLTIDVSYVTTDHRNFADRIEDDTSISIRNASTLTNYAAFKTYLDKFKERNIKNLDLILYPPPFDATELKMIQDIDTFIKENNSLESV